MKKKYLTPDMEIDMFEDDIYTEGSCGDPGNTRDFEAQTGCDLGFSTGTTDTVSDSDDISEIFPS